jgi:hypothetical protein
MHEEIEHRRRSLRLKGIDLSLPGNYFITICTANRKNLFGEITDRKMLLNRAGETDRTTWLELPQKFPSVTPKDFVVMPNRFHGIVGLRRPIPLPKDHPGAASPRPLRRGVAPDVHVPGARQSDAGVQIPFRYRRKPYSRPERRGRVPEKLL